MNCQKSAEAIVLRHEQMEQEGLNVRRFPELERLDRKTKKADNTERWLPV